MAQPLSNMQLPLDEADVQMLQQGIALGQQYAQDALVKARKWAEENPGQFLLAGIAAGFIVGKLLFRAPRRRFVDDF